MEMLWTEISSLSFIRMICTNNKKMKFT